MMFWHNSKDEAVSQDGDFRTIKTFLWWPKTLNGITRWLELAEICQVYEVSVDPQHDDFREEWVDLGWDDIGPNTSFRN